MWAPDLFQPRGSFIVGKVAPDPSAVQCDTGRAGQAKMGVVLLRAALSLDEGAQASYRTQRGARLAVSISDPLHTHRRPARNAAKASRSGGGAGASNASGSMAAGCAGQCGNFLLFSLIAVRSPRSLRKHFEAQHRPVLLEAVHGQF
jgi:hypothetical protein